MANKNANGNIKCDSTTGNNDDVWKYAKELHDGNAKGSDEFKKRNKDLFNLKNTFRETLNYIMQDRGWEGKPDKFSEETLLDKHMYYRYFTKEDNAERRELLEKRKSLTPLRPPFKAVVSLRYSAKLSRKFTYELLRKGQYPIDDLENEEASVYGFLIEANFDSLYEVNDYMEQELKLAPLTSRFENY